MRNSPRRIGASLEALMTPAPLTIGPDATLREAVDRLAGAGVSALPVTVGETVVGLLSAQAIIDFESMTPGVPTERDTIDVWEELPDPTDDVPSAEYFAELWDDTGLDVLERFRASETPEWDVLSEHTVEEAMTRSPAKLPSTASVRDAALLMRTTGSHGILVVDAGCLRGIVTTMDIARLVSGGGSHRP